ncbi:MAG: SGNH/GDSL hydrolase family protein [Capsulimonadales bacterium]|nr:SGNH/GDSL hydrolase family protein [Capsulimonadales bacterium]
MQTCFFRRTLVVLSVLTLGATVPALAQSTAPPKSEPQSYPERTALWEKAIVAFETADREKGTPPPGGILFVGSSSIVQWKTLATDFPGLPTINRGFGGSHIPDSTFYAARIVLPYAPKTVVLYAGDNDIAAGHTSAQVTGDFQTFALKIRSALPEAKILYLAIKPSPSRWKFQDRIQAANKNIADWIGTQKNMAFVDVHTPMLGENGEPRPELYVADRLHLSPEGYKLWTQVLAPYLKP